MELLLVELVHNEPADFRGRCVGQVLLVQVMLC